MKHDHMPKQGILHRFDHVPRSKFLRQSILPFVQLIVQDSCNVSNLFAYFDALTE
jgi:hypothetical protein